MDTALIKEASNLWKQIATGEATRQLELELDIHKRLLNFFQVGDFYYYIFNLKDLKFDVMSKDVKKVLGYAPEELDLTAFLEKIHPEDSPWFVNFENKAVDFFSTLPLDQIPDYKVSYDYRIRKKDGSYTRILQQVTTIQYNENGNLLKTFGVHTDISHLKKDGKPVLSFIGLNGKPSYVDVNTEQQVLKPAALLTPREREILVMIADGKGSKEIACELFISKETVHTHRKNILSKMDVCNTAQLIRKATRAGWL